MARGWESKSVEEQVEAQTRDQQQVSTSSSDKKADGARLRQRQALELQRDRILDERTSSPIRRRALEAALAEIESKLAAL